MSEQAEKRTYKHTLNLPKTSFAMKANLVQREPEFQKRWAKLDVYRRLLDARRDAETFVLHDGPPYANGSIHLGHLLNKVLKDVVVRSRAMLGYRTPFVPGWDCHGLPIEHKVMKDLGDAGREMSAIQIRRKCQKDAEKFVKLQASQMQRLGTIGDYADPYLTMAPAYEAATLEVFADLVAKGLVYRDLKPVHWSIANRTALAEAELEYMDRQDTSVYVLFAVENPQDLPLSLNARPGLALSLMIWTTTPWTLPANLAVAAAPTADYAMVRYQHEERQGLAIVASQLVDRVFSQVGATYEKIGYCTGAELEAANIRYRHPFIDRVSPLVTAEYVTLEDGTGLVHTAPGHGTEDYQTGLRYKLDVYCPVQEDGTFDPTAPDWLAGKSVWDGNKLVVDRLRESGHLFHDNVFTHSYPHDWRSKTPVIFRATEQWFVGVERPFDVFTEHGRTRRSLRQRAMEAVESRVYPLTTTPLTEEEKAKRLRMLEVHPQFVPAWGRNRMRGMLESRPDWCISRQRAWGLPIPAFIRKETGETLMTEASVRHIAMKVREKGSDIWFLADAMDLLAGCPGVENPGDYEKSGDIFDVWFESGSSWNAVLRQRGLNFPADLYLEGSDQHRGWFQLSLLPALGVTGEPPFKAVLTHGFMVDKHGRKMSKSLGSTIYTDQVRSKAEDNDALMKKIEVDDLLERTGLIGKASAPTEEVLAFYDADTELQNLLDRDAFLKILSNAIDVDELLKDYGADVCRWWVASLAYENDIKVDIEFFRLAGEEYRKVRNTIRFLLSNLGDFDPRSDRRELTAADAGSIDAWAMRELASLIRTVTAGYESYTFRKVRDAIFEYCNETLSAVYLAATKDRLYCDPAGSDRRRRTQTAMWDIADALIRLVAPVLVHTADEAYQSLHGAAEAGERCVHLETLPEPRDVVAAAGWDAALALRSRALKHLEDARAQRGIDNPLDAGVDATLPHALYEQLQSVAAELADLCGVSRFDLEPNGNETIIIDDLRNEPRCERSWKRDGTVRQRSDGGMLTDRDAAAVGV